MTEAHRLRVAGVERLTADSVAVTFEVPARLRHRYRAECGQNVVVRWRADGDAAGSESGESRFSLCGPAGGALRIGVRRRGGGAFSVHAVARLRVGDEVVVSVPQGGFGTTADPRRARSVVAIAVGSGIAPILSHVATALQVEAHSEVRLVYANRRRGSIMFAEELAALARSSGGRLRVEHVLSREEVAGHRTGRLEGDLLAAVIGEALVRPPDEWYVCGPGSMVLETRRLLELYGVAAERIHTEPWAARAAVPDRAARS